MSECRCFMISGHVQGVFFRVSTQEQAIKLGLTGYAQNLSDGRVKVEVCGDAKKLGKLREWLWLGPVNAKVDAIDECESVDILPNGFHIR